MVTKLLEQAMREIAALPEDDQEAIAQIILDELAEPCEPTKPTPSLREMLEEARKDYREGRTIELDPDNL